jgi:membrane associated rhomboid family serine protease
MTAMDETSLPPPPSRAEVERCYRHPDVETGVHCTRCGKPICAECMIQAPVGHQCPDCVAGARQEFRRGPGRRIAVAEAKGTSVVKVLLVAIGVMYLVEVVTSGPGSLMTGPGSRRLIELGGQVPLAPSPEGPIGVAAGQYWRLFTAMFLHAGLIHAGLNSWVLFIVGTPLERDLGRLRFAAVYLVSGLFASSASFAFTALQADRTDGGIQGLLVVSIGASGAVFGLFGAFVASNWRQRHQALAMARLRAILPWIVLNLVLSFSVGFIDWRAHVGGLVAGLVAGYVAEGVGRSEAQRRATTIAGFVAVLAATVALTAFGTARIRGLLPELF